MGRIFFTDDELGENTVSFTPEELEYSRQQILAKQAAKTPEQKAREARGARNVYNANEGRRRERYAEYLREAAKMDYPRALPSAMDSHVYDYPARKDWEAYDRKVADLRKKYLRDSMFVNPDAPTAAYEPNEGLTDMLNAAGLAEDDVRVPVLLGRGLDFSTKESASRYFDRPMTEEEFNRFKEKYGK